MPQTINNLVANATVSIGAPAARVWDALINPDKIKQYMMGATVDSKWKEGSPITWKGEFKGKKFEDKGVILKMTPERLLKYTHFSPMGGKPDKPENYHNVTVELMPSGSKTEVKLSQDGNASDEERQHSEQNWNTMLEGLKKVVEKG